jgi:predicted amidohydrolase
MKLVNLESSLICTFVSLASVIILLYPAPAKAAAGEPFKVASVQFNPALNDRDGNLAKLAEAIEEAAAAGAKLIVAPEMSTTGYAYPSREAIAPYMDTASGVAAEALTKIAAKHQVYIVIGFAEKDPKTLLYYNSSILVGPEGVLGVYRKSHLWEAEEHWSSWGDLGVPVFDTPLGRIAINICFDSAFFEPARLAGLDGADILAFPTNSTSQAMWALQARALQNGFYVVSANRSNTELGFSMIGASAIWSPEGKLLAEAPLIKSKADDVDETTIIYAEIDPKLYDNPAKSRLAERRPELYSDLTLKSSPWDYTASTEPKKIVSLSLQYELGADPKQTLEKIETLLAAELKNGPADLVVLPEYALTGPPKDAGEAAKLAENLDGPNLSKLKALASANAFHLVFGFIDKDGNKLYPASALIGPDGEIIDVYRKTHLYGAEKSWAEAGSRFVIASTALGKIGLMLGGEELFPEVAGILTVKRADIIAISASWDLSYGDVIGANAEMPKNPYPSGASCLWDSLALTTQAYTVAANFTGGSYAGASGLYALDPLYGLDQTIITPAGNEAALRAEFTTLAKDWWFNQYLVTAERRTDMYLPLTLIKK